MANVAEEEVKVFRVPKAIQVNQAHPVRLGFLALMVQRVSGETQASKESLVLLERMESQDHQEKEVPQGQMGHRGHQVSQVSLAWQDPLERPGQLVNPGHPDQLEFQVIPDDQETQEKKVLLDHLDLEGNLEYLVNLDCQDFLGKEDYQDCRYS